MERVALVIEDKRRIYRFLTDRSGGRRAFSIATSDQNFRAREDGRSHEKAIARHRRNRTEGPTVSVKEFSALEGGSRVVETARYQHVAIAQHGSQVPITRRGHVAGRTEQSRHRIVQLG